MIKLIPLKKEVKVVSAQRPVQLSAARQKDVEEFWSDINKDGIFHRGEVFTIESVTEEKDMYKILLDTTDYAHYLHTVKKDIYDKESCRTIFGAGLVETTDSHFIYGEMASNTAFPGRLQCAGGGLSKEDMNGHSFDFEKSVLREVSEELGIEKGRHVVQCQPLLIKDVHIYDSLVVLYYLKVNLSEKELRENYQRYIDELTSNNELPEFQNIISIENNKDAVNSFFDNDNRSKDDYLEAFLKYLAK